MQYQLGLHDVRRPVGDGGSGDGEPGKNCLPLEDETLLKWYVGCEGAEDSRSVVVDELLRIHEYERQRMGQELHDTAGQLLVALHLSVAHLRAVEKNSGRECLVDEMQEIIRQIDQQIRSLAFLHYPAELDERGLCSAIDRLVRGFDRRTGIRTGFKVLGQTEEFEAHVSEALLRVAQEALVNIHRHAHASSAKVQLERRSGEIRLSISDDGVGLPGGTKAVIKGVGLMSMAHRAHVLGGKLEMRKLKHGFKIVATIPVH